MTVQNAIIPDHACIVYVIAADPNGPCKIGITTNVMTRLISLQTGYWLPLRCWGFRMVIKRDGTNQYPSMLKALWAGARATESRCHTVLSEMDLRMVGEWFDVTAAEALAVVDKCAKERGAMAVSLQDVMGIQPDPGLDAAVAALHKKLARSMVEIAYATSLDRIAE